MSNIFDQRNPTSDIQFLLGTVQGLGGSGNGYLVKLDTEQDAGQKGYGTLLQSPAIGSRVLLVQFGGTRVILGQIYY